MRDLAGGVGKAANAIGSVSPIRWYERMPSPHVSDRFDGAALRCFDGTSPTIEQPALTENVVAMHLGGPKRVTRWQGSCQKTWDVPSNSITFMPAFQANRLAHRRRRRVCSPDAGRRAACSLGPRGVRSRSRGVAAGWIGSVWPIR